MKIYTKTGDAGTTGLFGGQRVSKAADRIESYGTIDELNAELGLAATHGEDKLITSILLEVQSHLMVIGSHLATPYTTANDAPDSLPLLRNKWLEYLEAQIDTVQADLPELKTFILPGGTQQAAALHMARTVCRRAERHIVRMSEDVFVDALILQYLNRLSDTLFVLARRANHIAGVEDVEWNAHT